ncbi:metallophosphoesterase [Fulvivirgaceae bacterium PWU4]|uniref:Metallophosphoesterase n=1 Tax=Chryseosolibacter histidini TaxID=2782349 RepID=A0AAP2DI83_9BACT|nr:metallophosphoesterase [Chryseosolibacter histidini]MBT1696064.1 metallophosphoesterase [Chryseosolibacter histidini]
MLIQYCSDLHLEFPTNKRYLKANPIKPKGEILLLAGDIVPFTEIEKEKDFLDFLSGSFEHTYWIPGNHEYYRSDLTERTGAFDEKIRSNVSLINNSIVQHKDVRLIFSTLWSKLDLTKEWVIKKTMADFHLIRKNGNKINVDDYNALYDEALAFIKSQLPIADGKKTIVVTHHIPTFYNYAEKYRYSELNSAFATELFDLIEASNVDYWIYGHSHEVVPDFRIGKTTLTTNQLGYVEYGENGKFQRNLILEL